MVFHKVGRGGYNFDVLLDGAGDHYGCSKREFGEMGNKGKRVEFGEIMLKGFHTNNDQTIGCRDQIGDVKSGEIIGDKTGKILWDRAWS